MSHQDHRGQRRKEFKGKGGEYTRDKEKKKKKQNKKVE
jgi:hypothetical protein